MATAFDILLPTLLLTILGWVAAQAWGNTANAYFRQEEYRDPTTGKVRTPVLQMTLYATAVTVLAFVLLWSLHQFGVIDLTLVSSK